jgi:hypothetical protein
MTSPGKTIAKETTAKLRDEAANFVIEKLVDAAERARKKKLTPSERRALEVTGQVVTDTAFFIWDELLDGRLPTRTTLVKYVNMRAAHVAGIIGQNETLCVTAMVSFALDVATLVPPMMAIKPATTALTIPGFGLKFAVPGWVLLLAGGALVVASARDTALQCAASAETVWQGAAAGSSGGQKPVMTLSQQTQFTLVALAEFQRRGGQCVIPRRSRLP